MTRAFARWTLLVGTFALAACGSDPNPPDPVDCSAVAPVSLSAGQYTILDASETACVRIPGAGAQEAEYLYVALSANGTVTRNGNTAPYELRGGPSPSAAVAATSQAVFDKAPSAALAFHDMLRARERTLSQQPSAVGAARARISASVAAAVPPVLGSQRTFDVCATTTCDSFVTSTATAKVVTDGVAIYLDDAAPVGYTQTELQDLATLFDAHLYSIDTTAFGPESDLDGNGVVIVLLTQHVNDLSPDCNTTGSFILGFFFGLDLLPSQDHSNDGEVFYGAVPRDAPGCSAYTKANVTRSQPGVFVHEFQHMISFNQHVLVHGGDVEDTWLNEGLSHFAEELAARQVPDNFCPAFSQCEDQFLGDDLFDAYGYLDDPESTFLVAPETSGGTLEERGAAWLFVRWLGDHFAATQPLAPEVTRGLLLTNLTGAANVENVTGVDFPTLVAQWQLANYLTNLPGFTPSSDRLRYTGFDLRAIYLANYPGVFAKPYPLTPDSTRTGAYDRTGVLRAGSGRHVRIIQPPGSSEVAFVLTDGAGSIPLASSTASRIALARVR